MIEFLNTHGNCDHCQKYLTAPSLVKPQYEVKHSFKRENTEIS